MKKKIVAVLIVLAFAFVVSAAETDYGFPNLTIYDADGKEVQLEDFRGKPVVLNFWASWCGPCKNEMPAFEEVYKEYGEDIHFLMVNLTDGRMETVEKATAFIDSKGYTFPVYFDTSQDASITLNITSIPMTFFLDDEGNGIAYAAGAISKDIVIKGIEMAKEGV